MNPNKKFKTTSELLPPRVPSPASISIIATYNALDYSAMSTCFQQCPLNPMAHRSQALCPVSLANFRQ